VVELEETAMETMVVLVVALEWVAEPLLELVEAERLVKEIQEGALLNKR
jgi:hypothetical protein